jgi:hypothetical protein
MTMGCPSKLYANCYPADFTTTWPIDEGYFNTRYVWAHNEFTPQQTMRGKMALYGYLYAIGKLTSSAIQWKRRTIANRFAGNASLTIDNISLFLPNAGTYTIRIIDVSGKTLNSTTRRIESHSALHGIFPKTAGLYFLELRGGKQAFVQKVMVPR